MNLQNQTHVFVLEDGQAEQIMRMYYYLPKKTIQNCNETLFKISIKNAGNFSLKKKPPPIVMPIIQETSIIRLKFASKLVTLRLCQLLDLGDI